MMMMLFDIGVSGDGTWRKTGFSSSFRVVTAISLLTGKALNIEKVSKECCQCMGWRDRQGTSEFHEWWDSIRPIALKTLLDHLAQWMLLECLLFFRDPLRIIHRKSHNFVVSESVYGDIEVTKLASVGHLQKRMGSRLCSLKKRMGQAKILKLNETYHKSMFHWSSISSPVRNEGVT